MMLLTVLALLTSVCAICVVLRRLTQSEVERLALREEIETLSRGGDEREALAAVGLIASELCKMVVSPVTVILGQCELARSQGQADRRLDAIERQARRIADVVERHRGLADSQCAEVREIEPAACARAALGATSRLAKERDVTVHEMLEDSPRIRINPFLLTHALRHMLRSAIEASPKGKGDVTFAMGYLPGAHGEEDYLAFAVADDGPGIEPLALPRVFHPFPEESGTWRSTGFGYSVVYAIARATGATIVLDTAPGAGTRATFKVPLPKKVEKSTPIAEPVHVEA